MSNPTQAKRYEPPQTPLTGGRHGRRGWRHVVAGILVGDGWALAIPIVLGVLLLAFPWLSGYDAYWIRAISLIAVLALVVSGVNLSFGYAGEVQFGQVFMFALGGYVSGVLAVHQGYTELIPLALLAGVLASLVGLVVAVPAVRIGGWSLAMASFFLVLIIPNILNITEKWSGGAPGLIGIPAPTVFGTELDPTGLYYACAIALILWLALFRNLVTSRYGVIFRILRESPVQAASLGFSTPRLKALAYSFGALPAGVAGCLFGFLNQILSPSSFGINLAIGVVAASVLGGVEAIYVVAVGATILHMGPELSLDFQEYSAIIYGLFLIAAAVLLRQGISGIARQQGVRLSRRLVGDGPVVSATVPGSLSGHLVDVEADEDAVVVAPPALPPSNGVKLEVGGVSKAFGGVKAVQDVSLAAEPGKITALIGSNGSGKTTLLNVICGFNAADAGSVRFGDTQLTGMVPFQVARLGVGRTFQTPSVPRGVSVLDVVASGRFISDRVGPASSIFRLPRYWRVRGSDRHRALELLDLVGLADQADEEAVELSLGTRRLVEVARALCAEPRLLLLDEPASGLSEDEVKRLGIVIRAAADAGMTVILIEHNFRFVTGLADIAHVLHLGKLIASGPAATIGENQAVIESYLGTSSEETSPSPRVTVTEAPKVDDVARKTVLELRDAVTGYGDLRVLRGMSLKLVEGEISVLLGRNGVGKTTTLAAISGQLGLWEGQVVFDGEDITKRPSFKRAAAGIALVQEGKRIFRQRTVLENLMIGTYTLTLSRERRAERCEELMRRFPILKERADQPAGGLSGGQQQMLAIAQALAAAPRVLLLDEPSAGLAPSIIGEVFDHIRQLREDGMTILLVEQLAEQALAVANHVTVIDNGAIVTSGPPDAFSDLRELQEAYFGDAARA